MVEKIVCRQATRGTCSSSHRLRLKPKPSPAPDVLRVPPRVLLDPDILRPERQEILEVASLALVPSAPWRRATAELQRQVDRFVTTTAWKDHIGTKGRWPS